MVSTLTLIDKNFIATCISIGLNIVVVQHRHKYLVVQEAKRMRQRARVTVPIPDSMASNNRVNLYMSTEVSIREFFVEISVFNDVSKTTVGTAELFLKS